MSQVSYDEDGFVRGFPYHDGELNGILTGVKGDAYIAFASSQGEARVLRLCGLKALHVGNFLQGNIILDMRVYPAARARGDAEIERRLMERLFLGVSSLSDDALVFVLDSSYGADVIAVCQGLEVFEGRLSLVRSYE